MIFLFIDNAQNWQKVAGKVRVDILMFVVAAFSPGLSTNITVLGKSLDDDKYDHFCLGTEVPRSTMRGTYVLIVAHCTFMYTHAIHCMRMCN